MRNGSKVFAGLFTCLLADCTIADDSHRVEVVGHNALGIVDLDAVRFVENGEPIYVLHALDARGEEVASVRRRLGSIVSTAADGTQAVGSGSVLELTARGQTTELVTYDGARAQLPGMDAEFAAFLAVPEVVTELAGEQILVPHVAAVSAELPFITYACPASVLLAPSASSPIARQCCYDVRYTETVGGDITYRPDRNMFIPDRGPNVGKVIRRELGPVCTRSDGVTTCTSGKSPAQGGDCYYGPAGWAIQSIQTPSAGQTFRMLIGSYSTGAGTDTSCNPVTTSGSSPFSDITGTAGTGFCSGGSSSSIGWQGEF